MTEQLISFETAKLTKKKGFAVGTRTRYTIYHKTQKSDNPLFRMTKGEIELSADYMMNNDLGDLSSKTYSNYEAPTQSLLQKWLREIHDLQINVTWNKFYSNTPYQWEVRPTWREQLLRPYGYSGMKLIYEEALETALFEALKLLPDAV